MCKRVNIAIVLKKTDPIPLNPRYLFFFLYLALLTLPRSSQAQEQLIYNAWPLKAVIEDIENREGYRFLYRDVLIAGKYLTFATPADSLIPVLQRELLLLSLDLKVDPGHRQILISEAKTRRNIRTSIIRGQVLDGETGARLPFANITWVNAGELFGVSTNDAGYFHLQLDNRVAPSPDLLLAVSYVGYKPVRVEIDLESPPGELSIRLTPERIQGQEVLVQSSLLHTDLDTTWHHLLYAGVFSPFGESSILRSLQPLPAVSMSTAISEGLNVRGSKADGFQVLLDGAPIYNQNHLYGLFDVFNEDALQTVGFYYDIAPASYFAPPGGTISFITRTGSLSGFSASAGASNTAFRGTFEGPLAKGRASWLVSGRHSLIDQINWLNNENLLGLGLNIDRTIGQLPAQASDFEDFIINPTNTNARFFDMHGKFSLETRRGGRSTLSLYTGGNNASLDAERLIQVRRQDNDALDPVYESVQTSNEWGNQAASLQFQDPVGDRSYLQTIFSVSHYSSRFAKSDFTYTRFNSTLNRSQNFLAPFQYKNELIDVKWAHHLSIAPSHPGLWSFGASGNFYALNYEEQSAIRPAFGEDYYAIQADTYGEYEYKASSDLHLRAGLRLHYFTQGHVFRLSPRLQLTLLPQNPLSMRVGYSRNYQFLHQLFLENTNSASMWVITTGSHGPSHVENTTAGLYLDPFPSASLQVEGYYRTYGNLRRHEINAPTQTTTNSISNFVPWFSNSNAYAKGLEFMYNQQIGPATWTNSYTLSRIDLQNDEVLDGERYPAEWDRKHQFTSNVQINFSKNLSANLTWYYASGNTNTLAYVESEQEVANRMPEASRLPDYHRLDASLKMIFAMGEKRRIEARASLYNVYDNANVWYREPIQVFRSDRPGSSLRFYNVDVFDLGMQPAFDLSITL